MSVLAIPPRFEPFFKDGFLEWLDENEHIYDAFEAQALKLIALGRTHYSARTIIEVLVHHSILREVGETEFKIGNDKAPDLARVFVVKHREHKDFWEYRRADWQAFKTELEV